METDPIGESGGPQLVLLAAASDAAEAAIEAAHALFVCVPDSAHAEYVERGLDAGFRPGS